MIQLHHLDFKKLSDYHNPASIDCAITSPPYFDKDGYYATLGSDLGLTLDYLLKDNGLAFINFGFVRDDPARMFRMRDQISDYLTYVHTFIWLKHVNGRGRFSPKCGCKQVNNFWEPIFVFSCGDDWAFDRLAVGVELTDKSNIRRRKNPANPLRCAGDVLFYPYENKTGKKGFDRLHRYGYPSTLVKHLIKLAGIKQDGKVLDPFAGYGTTLFAADELGYSGVGSEVDQKCFDFIVGKAKHVGAQLTCQDLKFSEN